MNVRNSKKLSLIFNSVSTVMEIYSKWMVKLFYHFKKKKKNNENK